MAVTVSKLTEVVCDMIERSVSINRHVVYLWYFSVAIFEMGLMRLPHTVGSNYRKAKDYGISHCLEKERKIPFTRCKPTLSF
jgi:hypothetical protein